MATRDIDQIEIIVVQTTNPSYIGVSGIVIQETLSMFKIITKDNKLKRKEFHSIDKIPQ